MKSLYFFQIAVLAAGAMVATSTHAQEILVVPTAPPATIYEAVPPDPPASDYLSCYLNPIDMVRGR